MNKLILAGVVFIVFLVFRSWLNIDFTLSAGDWPYLYTENILEFSSAPDIKYLWLSPYYQLLPKLLHLNLELPWYFLEKIIWFWPFLILSIVSSYIFYKSSLSTLIYVTNTYILMLVGGGQMGVAISYSVAPLVFYFFTRNTGFNKSILFISRTLILALITSYDPRISLIVITAVAVYEIWMTKSVKLVLNKLFFPLTAAGLLNSYWIIPLLKNQKAIALQLGEATAQAVKYLSFAAFPQALSLLHPNWPENIFGKVYFMRPEFLLLPILAFGGFLFISKITVSPTGRKNQKNREIIFYTFLLLLGAFLAKGANPPFGGIYLWIFDKIPGFSLFRDPTKFYILIALAYSYLIPQTLNLASEYWKNKPFNKLSVSFAFIILWVILSKPALTGQLSGTFKPVEVPTEYLQFKNLITGDTSEFSILWVPTRQRFGFQDQLHPGLELSSMIGSNDIDIALSWFDDDKAFQRSQEWSVKYIVVPFDIRGEIFIKDRQFSNSLYQETKNYLDQIDWLKKVQAFQQLGVYEVSLR